MKYCSEQAPQSRINKTVGEWIFGGNCTTTPVWRRIMPRVTPLCQWIIIAWQRISAEVKV